MHILSQKITKDVRKKKRYFSRVAIFASPAPLSMYIRDAIFDGMKSFREIAIRFEIISHQLKLDLLFHIRIYIYISAVFKLSKINRIEPS